jgi:hypothetical protein
LSNSSVRPSQLREDVEQLLGQAVREVLLVLVRTHVGERQYADGLAVDARRGIALVSRVAANAAGPGVVGPAQYQRDGEADDQEGRNERDGPFWQPEGREHDVRDLHDQPAGHEIYDRDTKDLAVLEF